MLYASIERSPVFLGKLISFDETKAKTVKGVRFVLKTQRHVWGQVREGCGRGSGYLLGSSTGKKCS